VVIAEPKGLKGDELHDVIHQISVDPTDHPEFTSEIDHGSKSQGGQLSHRCFTVTFIPALTDRNGASPALIGTTTESSSNDKARQHRFDRQALLTIT
tara:strand:+ start:208 stop:498 length:291 start_codon:yes stop_codon:yes gene_type:complete